MTEAKQQDNILMLVNVRAAFLNLFVATAVNDGDKKSFSASFLMPPDHPDVVKVRAAITEVANQKWGEKAAEYLRGMIAGDKVCLHNGDIKSEYDGFPGNLFVSARSPRRPLALGADKSPLTEADGKLYSGCYVNAQIAIWAMDNNWGKRVCAQLRGVQFFRDGDAFGGGAVSNEDEFDNVDDSADADAPGIGSDVSDLW